MNVSAATTMLAMCASGQQSYASVCNPTTSSASNDVEQIIAAGKANDDDDDATV